MSDDVVVDGDEGVDGEIATLPAPDDSSKGADADVAQRASDDHSETAHSLTAVPPMPLVADGPAPELRYHRALEVGTTLRQLMEAWHIIWGLIVRQLRTQYSQQVLGIAWEVLGPLAQMVMFTVVLNNVSTKSSFATGGVPKALFLYVGLLVWSFYSSSLTSGAGSLTGNPLLNKVYAPREVFPIAQVATSGIDALVSVALFPLLCWVFHTMPSVETFYYTIPLTIVLVMFTTAITLFVSALAVYARDLRSGLPLLTSLGMLMPGILYPVARVHSLHSVTAHTIYTVLFPVSAIAEGFRDCVFFHAAPNWHWVGIAAIASSVYLVAAFLFFKRLEAGFADVS